MQNSLQIMQIKTRLYAFLYVYVDFCFIPITP